MATKTTTKTTRTRGPGKAELLIAILSAKTQTARDSQIASLKPSKGVVRKAAIDMADNEVVLNTLETYANQQGYSIHSKRGRFAPCVGETRVYNVQQVKDDATFIRLPLSSLEVQKGKKVRVDFEQGEIIVRAVPTTSVIAN